MNIASNDNNASTPNRVRNAFRDDAVRAAEVYAALPPDRRSEAAYDSALRAAQPYLDFLAVAELFRTADISVNDAQVATPDNDTGFAVEFRHDVRPSEEEMLEAYSDGTRNFVRRSPRGDVERFEGGVQYHSGDNATTIGGRASVTTKSGTRRGRFYGLHFHRGKLIYFSQNGRREWAIDQQSDPRGEDADNDNYEIVQLETTCTPGAPDALEELERHRRGCALRAEIGAEKTRLAEIILQADDFVEIARAAGLNPTSHNGRRVATKTLREINLIIAA